MTIDNGRVVLCPAVQNGASGWRLTWRVQGPGTRAKVALAHWYADVDDASAVKWAMERGSSFEEAHAALYRGALDVDAVTARRVVEQVRRATRKRELATARRRRALSGGQP